MVGCICVNLYTKSQLSNEPHESYSQRSRNKHIVVTKERIYDSRNSWWITEIEIDGKKFLAIQGASDASPTLHQID